MFCLGGIGGHLSGFVQSARDVPQMVAVDGCNVACAKAILSHSEVPLQNYLVVTDLGIEKNKDFNLKQDDLKRVKEAVRDAAANGTSKTQAGQLPMQGCSCCG